MTELEKKAEEYARARNCETCYQAHLPPIYCLDVGNHCILCGHDKESFIVGYEQGISEKQLIVKIATDKNNELYEENELLKSKIKNVYEVRQKAQSEMISNLEKENEKLKAKIERMKCCANCKYHNTDLFNLNDYDYICCGCAGYNQWELPE